MYSKFVWKGWNNDSRQIKASKIHETDDHRF